MEEQLYTEWISGNPDKAGEQLYRSIEVYYRPIWAGKILELYRENVPVIEELEEAIEITGDKSRWWYAHILFGRIITLKLRNEPDFNQLHSLVLRLAENAMKITYNATDPTDSFDQGAGQWLVATMREIVDHVNNTEFTLKAWNRIKAIHP